MTLASDIKDYTEQIRQRGLLRTRLVRDDNSVIHFDSNDYLSLSLDPNIALAYQQGYANFPSGSGGSMLLSGYHKNHQLVESAFARFLEVDECVLFSSGYAANLALAALLGQIRAVCLIDKGVHASLYDGLSLAKVAYKRYLHNDLSALSNLLNASPTNTALITEGIFGMSGQTAPLDKIAALCGIKGTTLLVDEAHSFGILGRNGRGAVDYYGLNQEHIPLRTIAFGKAFSAQGALIAGKKEWIEALIQAGRSLIYSTAISPAMCYGLLKTLDIVIDAEERRNKLRDLIEFFRGLCKKSDLNWSNSTSPIQQLQLGCPYLALDYATQLKQQGLLCSAIRAPTVSTKATGLRIILNYCHTEEQISRLFNTLNRIPQAIESGNICV